MIVPPEIKEKRAELMTRVDQGEEMEFVFSVRPDKHKFYLYTEDQETLICSASTKNLVNKIYQISMSSTDYAMESPYFIGNTQVSKKNWFVVPSDFNSLLPLSFIQILVTKTPPGIAVFLPPKDKLKVNFSQYGSLDNCSILTSTEQGISLSLISNASGINLLEDNSQDESKIFSLNLFCEKKKVFKMQQILDDEYSVTISEPLSPFFAFCISLFAVTHKTIF